jgi:hypothetical protein
VEGRADQGKLAAGQEQLAGRGEPGEPRGILADLFAEGRVDREPCMATRSAGRSTDGRAIK